MQKGCTGQNNRQFQLRSPAEELLNEYFEITYDENEGTYLSPSAIFTYLKEKAGSSLRVTNIRSLDRMLANMEGIRRRRVNAGTQYLLKNARNSQDNATNATIMPPREAR